MKNYLLGCDWGTSSFRLGLCNLTNGALIDEIRSSEGIAGIHRSWQNGQYENRGITKDNLFRERLLKQIDLLAARTALALAHTPVIISGMASSSIGIAALPYAGLPFGLDGKQVKSRRFDTQPGFLHEIILLSGVQSNNDVMRGEETQLIGIRHLLAAKEQPPGEAVFIFPGTHSKHLYIKENQLVAFKSFMTGEMYQVIGNHSLLKDSVKIDGDQEIMEADRQAFLAGVKESGKNSLLNGLFTVRTNQLFNRWDKTQNGYYLSGLLIGGELADLTKEQNKPLYLCSGKNLYPLYKLAMEEMSLTAQTTFVPVSEAEKAAITGQKIMYDHYVNNTLLYG